MPTLDEVRNDPEFYGLPDDVKRDVLRTVDPDFAKLGSGDQNYVLAELGKRRQSLPAGAEQTGLPGMPAAPKVEPQYVAPGIDLREGKRKSTIAGDIADSYKGTIGEAVAPGAAKATAGVVGRLAGSVGASGAGVVTGLGNILHALGTVAESETLRSVGGGVASAGKTVEREFIGEKTGGEGITGQLPEIAGSAIGSMMGFRAIGGAVGKGVGAAMGSGKAGAITTWLASSAVETGTTAGGVYEEALGMGQDPKKAAGTAGKFAAVSGLMTAGLNAIGDIAAKKIKNPVLAALADMGGEITQEDSEQITQNMVLGKPWNEGVAESTIGAVFGSLVGKAAFEHAAVADATEAYHEAVNVHKASPEAARQVFETTLAKEAPYTAAMAATAPGGPVDEILGQILQAGAERPAITPEDRAAAREAVAADPSLAEALKPLLTEETTDATQTQGAVDGGVGAVPAVPEDVGGGVPGGAVEPGVSALPTGDGDTAPAAVDEAPALTPEVVQEADPANDVKTSRTPTWEMSPDELDQAIAQERTNDRERETRFFGPEGAKRYRKLQEVANSNMRSHAETSKAADELEAMEAALPKAQRDELAGIGQDVFDVQQARDVRNAIGRLDTSSAEELGKSLKWAITRVEPDNPGAEPEAYAQLRHAARVAEEKGWDTNAITREAVKAAADRFRDPNDAMFLLERFIKPKQQGEANTEPSSVAGQLEAPKQEAAAAEGEKLKVSAPKPNKPRKQKLAETAAEVAPTLPKLKRGAFAAAVETHARYEAKLLKARAEGKSMALIEPFVNRQAAILRKHLPASYAGPLTADEILMDAERAAVAPKPAAPVKPAGKPKKPTKARVADATKRVAEAFTAVESSAPGVPVSIPKLRESLPKLSKAEFDAAVLAMADRGEVELTTHDHGPALSEAERERLVHDPNTKDDRGRPAYYVAATRREQGGTAKPIGEALASRIYLRVASARKRLASPPFDRTISRDEALREVRADLIPPTDKRPPVILTNHQGMEVIRAARGGGKPVAGLALDVAGLAGVIRYVEQEELPGASRETRRAIARLSSLLGSVAQYGEGVALVDVSQSRSEIAGIAREELTHMEQFRLGGRTHADNEAVLAHPAAERAIEHLSERMGYPGDDSFVMVAESTAKIAAGKWARLGLTEEEAKDYFLHYVQTLEKQHGDRAANVARWSNPRIRRHIREQLLHGATAGVRRAEAAGQERHLRPGVAGEDATADEGTQGRREGSVRPGVGRDLSPENRETDVEPFASRRRMPRIAALFARMSYQPNMSDEQLLKGTKAKVWREPGEAPVIVTNLRGLDLITRLTGTWSPGDNAFNLGGVYLDPEMVKDGLAAWETRYTALRGDLQRRAAEIVGLLRESAESGHGVVVLVDHPMFPTGKFMEVAAREEWDHDLQRQLAQALGGATPAEHIHPALTEGLFQALPMFRKAGQSLVAGGYPADDRPYLMAEIGVRLMRENRHGELALSRQELEQLATYYVRAVRDNARLRRGPGSQRRSDLSERIAQSVERAVFGKATGDLRADTGADVERPGVQREGAEEIRGTGDRKPDDPQRTVADGTSAAQGPSAVEGTAEAARSDGGSTVAADRGSLPATAESLADLDAIFGPERGSASADLFGASLIVDGVKVFSAWRMRMVERFGAEIKPKLLTLWSKARALAKELWADESGSMDLAVMKYYFERQIDKWKQRRLDARDILIPLETRIRNAGGGELLRRMDAARIGGRTQGGLWMSRLQDGGLSKLSDKQASDLGDMLQGFKAVTPELQDAFDAVRGVTDHIATVADGLGMKAFTSAGRREFKGRKNFMPRVFRPAEVYRDNSGFRLRVAENMVRNHGFADRSAADAAITEFAKFLEGKEQEPKTLLDWMVKTGQVNDAAVALARLTELRSHVKRNGSIEHAREIDLPFYDPDPRYVLPYHAFASAMRLAQTAFLGQDGEVVSREVLKIARAGGDWKLVHEGVNRILHWVQDGETAEKRMGRCIRAWNVVLLSKAAIANVTQTFVNIPAYAGFRPLFVGLIRARTLQGKRFALQSGADAEKYLAESRKLLSGNSEADLLMRLYLQTQSESLNRNIAANAGGVYAEKILQGLKKDPESKFFRRRAQELQLDPAKLLERGSLTAGDRLKAAARFSEIINFRQDPGTLPDGWTSSELGRIMTQFKSFAYHQGRFVSHAFTDEIVNGWKGRDIRAGWSALYAGLVIALWWPLVGELVRFLQDTVAGREPKQFDSLAERWFADVTAVAGFGLPFDLLRAAGRGTQGVLEFFGGPTARVAEAIAIMGSDDDPEEKLRKFATWARRKALPFNWLTDRIAAAM